MPRDSESYGEPHTLTAYIEDGELTYDLEHPPACTRKVYTYEFACYGGESPTVEEWDCDVAQHEAEAGLFGALEYSGTPVTEPGTYRIQGWSRKTWYPSHGFEHEAGVGVMEPESASA
jgi:hypothetical protein